MAVGTLYLTSSDGINLPVTAYYSPQVDGTIILPTTIIRQHNSKYIGWMQFSNIDNKTGEIENIMFPIISKNDLWYHTTINESSNIIPKINQLSNAARYELLCQRTAHIVNSALEELQKHVKGVPKLKGNTLYKCPACMSGKLCNKQPIGKQLMNNRLGSTRPTPMPNSTIIDDIDTIMDTIYMPTAQAGQHFHMDFRFVRGSDFNYKDENGKTITSKDGKRVYLSIVDRATRFTWIFLTSSKNVPIEQAKSILHKFKSLQKDRTVHVDQGRELGQSKEFSKMVSEEEYTLEVTGSDSSAQNAIVESPNKTFGQMM
jgi:hypothetical protein